MNAVTAEVTRLLTEAGHAQAHPKPRRKNEPPQSAGFRVLPSPDGAVYVTWATAGSRPFEATQAEIRQARENVTAYASVLNAAGYQAEVQSTRLWSTARVLPADNTRTGP